MLSLTQTLSSEELSASFWASLFFEFITHDNVRKGNKKQDRKDGVLSPRRRPRLFSAAPLAPVRCSIASWRRSLLQNNNNIEEASDDEATGSCRWCCRCRCNRDDDNVAVDKETGLPQGHKARPHSGSACPR